VECLDRMGGVLVGLIETCTGVVDEDLLTRSRNRREVVERRDSGHVLTRILG
jgi:hypothetical protein